MQSFYQDQLIANINDFLNEISRGDSNPDNVEKIPENDLDGLCAGFSLLMLDADATDKQDPYIASLFKFTAANKDQIVAMAQLFNTYQKRFKEFIQANKTSLQDSISNEEKNRLLLINQYKTLTEELANLVKIPDIPAEKKALVADKLDETHKARAEFEKIISDKRKIHFERLHTEFLTMMKAELSEEQILLYQTAKAFYEFSHTLLATSGASFTILNEAGHKITNDDVIATLQLIGAPSATRLENQFSIYINLTDAEAEDLFNTVIFDKDKVSLTFQAGHNMYLKKDKNRLILFDPSANQLIEASTAKELVTQLRERFLQLFNTDPGEYIGYGIQIFHNKNEPIVDTRPTMEAKLREILERRKSSLNSYATDAQDLGGNTSLQWASGAHDATEARILLEYKADPNSKNALGNYPIHIASEFGRDNFIRELLANGADFEVKNSERLTPLLVAIKCGSLSTARLLLECKADPNLTGGETLDDPKTPGGELYEFVPLIETLKTGQDELVPDLLQKKAALEMKDIAHGVTALLTAAHTGNLPIVKTLLEHKAQCDILDKHGQNFLFGAVLSKNSALVSYLLQELKLPLDANCINEFGNTALVCAMHHKDWKIVSLLLEHGAIPFFKGANDLESRGIKLAHEAGQLQICVKMEYKEKISDEQNQWLKKQIDTLLEFKDESKESSTDKYRQKVRESVAEIVKSHSDPAIQFYLLRKCLYDHLNDWSSECELSSRSQLIFLGMLSKEKEPQSAGQFFNSIYALLKEIGNITRIDIKADDYQRLDKTYASNMLKGFPDPIPKSATIVTQRL